METVPFLGKNCYGKCDIDDNDIITIQIRYSNPTLMRRTLDHELSHATDMLIESGMNCELTAITIERCCNRARQIIPWYK